ncbi:MAG: hypothetical protein ACI4LE_03660, partial [Faecalibacterium sp.]
PFPGRLMITPRKGVPGGVCLLAHLYYYEISVYNALTYFPVSSYGNRQSRREKRSFAAPDAAGFSCCDCLLQAFAL